MCVYYEKLYIKKYENHSKTILKIKNKSHICPQKPDAKFLKRMMICTNSPCGFSDIVFHI